MVKSVKNLEKKPKDYSEAINKQNSMRETLITNKSRQVNDAWESTLPLLSEQVEYSGDFLARFSASTTNNPLVLFVPWGVRPSGTFGESELRALSYIERFQKNLNSYSFPSTVLIMPADVYAIEINNYPWEITTSYFNIVTDEARTRDFNVKPWSIIRDENRDQYDRILKWEANPTSLWPVIPKALWYRDLLGAAYRRSKQVGDQAITTAAFNYLRERIAEARIIETVYKPIKLSMVSPKKDDIVDCDLPRLYILPKELRFPWIAKGSDL